ncbi:hypothetical protein TNCV_2221871 [Trichonephila clavipes]|nr:hypothetical protein TNCV_2221871 [Trichonephila clavipes]
MINVTQVDERETSLDRKIVAPRSVIITRGAPCLRTISSNYYPFVSMSRLWKSPKEINSNAMERSLAGGWELNVQVVVEERIFSFGTPDNA